MKKEEENIEWDKRKILITTCIAIVAVILAVELKSRFLPGSESVLGESSEKKPISVQKPDVKPPNINFQSGVNSKISEIKQNINGLNAIEVASSSPQIQKVLQDIQGIKDLPSNQAKEMCLKICGGI